MSNDKLPITLEDDEPADIPTYIIVALGIMVIIGTSVCITLVALLLNTFVRMLT